MKKPNNATVGSSKTKFEEESEEEENETTSVTSSEEVIIFTKNLNFFFCFL